MEVKANQTNIVEEFMKGAKKGFYIGAEMIAPAMVMAYALIVFLDLKVFGGQSIMNFVGKILDPAMGLFGLPGDAVVALLAAFFAKAAGCAATYTLYSAGKLTAAQATILFPACVTMGTLVGHFARIVLVSNANKKFYPVLFAAPIIDAVMVMLITRVALGLMGN